MRGLELNRAFFEECGRPMLERDFPDLLPYLAAGSVGSGSENYGFDDEISRDHDFEPGFCLFLPGEDVVDRRRAFQLERAYGKLPKEYGGVKRLPLSPVGGNRHGVFRTAEFYELHAGLRGDALSTEQWLALPDYALAEAVNGEVYFDNYGEFSARRAALSAMPRDVRLKRLAGNLLLMGQAGQYNFARCLAHGEPAAAQLAAGEFVKAALKTLFLLREKYMPYYKWSFRALRETGNLQGASELLYYMLTGDNSEPSVARRKQETVEELAALVSQELRARDLSAVPGAELERHAYAVNGKISDGTIRNLHILAAAGD